MAVPLTQLVTDTLATIDIEVKDRLGVVARKLERITRNYETSGRIYSSEVMDVLTDVGGLLRETAQHVELTHLAQHVKA